MKPTMLATSMLAAIDVDDGFTEWSLFTYVDDDWGEIRDTECRAGPASSRPASHRCTYAGHPAPVNPVERDPVLAEPLLAARVLADRSCRSTPARGRPHRDCH